MQLCTKKLRKKYLQHHYNLRITQFYLFPEIETLYNMLITLNNGFLRSGYSIP